MRLPRLPAAAGHPAVLGAILLGGAVALLVGTGVAVVRSASSPAGSSGLTYSVLGADVRAALELVPAERWLRVDTVSAQLEGRRVSFDTLVVVADTQRFPAFRRGGFLDDQARAFNAYQRYRVEAASRSSIAFDSLAAFNPSLFRTGRSESGLPIVLRLANVAPMRVASPFEELWRGRVLAARSTPAAALAGREGVVQLRETAGTDADAACRVEREARLVRFYCASRERRPQVTLRLAAQDVARGTARVGWSPRRAPFRYDGAAGEPGDTLYWRGGGIVSIAGLAPGVFARVEPGLLSGTQWINGRVRRIDAAPPGLAFLGALGTRAAAGGARGGSDVALTLSVDVDLSRALGDSLAAFARDLPLDGAAVVLADAQTGEVLALGEAGTRLAADAGWLVRPLSVGSAVKPVLAAAVLSERPRLASLRIAAEPTVSRVFGYPAGNFESRLNCPAPADGWIDLAYFIRCSNNQYAVALTLAGVSEADGESLALVPGPTAPFELDGRLHTDRRPSLPLSRGLVPRDHLTGSALATGLLRSFNVDADVLVSDARGRNVAVWRGLRYSNGAEARVPRALQPEVSRPSLVARGERGTPTALLATYAYGGWGNQWTLLDLTQAYARLLSARRVVLSFAPGGLRDGADPTNEEERYGAALRWTDEAWYRTLTGALADVAEEGTAAGLAAAWRGAIDPGVTVYAKTGTLNERNDRLYLRTLAFGVGRRDGTTGAALGCGVVGVVYFKLRELPRGSATVPPLHTEFATRVLGPLLARNWERLGACARAKGPVAAR